MWTLIATVASGCAWWVERQDATAFFSIVGMFGSLATLAAAFRVAYGQQSPAR